MEFNLNKTPVGIISPVLDTVAEQPVDIDFTLPDFCSDIERIIRCKISPKIFSRNISGGKLQIDGSVVVTVLYTDENNKLRACEQNMSFSSSFALKSVPDNAVIETGTKCEYVNCRALSRRRLSIHGAFSLYAKVIYKSSFDLFSPCDDETLEYNTRSVTCYSLDSLCQEQFNCGDELQVGNKPSVDCILDAQAKINITSTKVVDEKLMLEGELGVKLLYTSSESDSPDMIDYIIPVSRVIDCEGLKSGDIVYPRAEILSCDIRLKNDILSDNPVVDADCRVCITVEGYSEKECEIVLDAFSTKHLTEIQRTRVTIPENISVVSDNTMRKDTVSIGDNNVSEIIDFRCVCHNENSSISNNNLNTCYKLIFNILAVNSDNRYVDIERSVEFSAETEINDDFNEVKNVSSYVQSVSYRLTGDNNIETRCELKTSALISDNRQYSIVSSVDIDEESLIKTPDSSLVLYFAENGESLWDIAKMYNTRLKRITEENTVSGDILREDTMLMIPTIREAE